MGNLMSVYNNSPIFMQNVFTTIQGYKLKKERFGKEYKEALREFAERDYSNIKELQSFQDEQLVKLVLHAYNNSPFYKEFYKNVDLSQIKGVNDIKKLPVLPKELVRESIEKMYAISPTEGYESNTSGTTGKTMKFYHTGKGKQRRMAYLDHFKIQHGFIPMKMRRASFNSSKIIPVGQKKKVFWRTNLAIKQRFYSGFHCKGDNVKYYVENLNKYKPHSLDGYPSAIYEVAKYIVDNNIKLTFTPIAIFPTAETLLPHYKKIIEKAFGCPVRDQYASSEGAPFITECKCGKLHYCMDTGIIETDDDGNMLVTCFETYGTPLIRYNIGDRAIFTSDNTKCDCGCSMPIVERIEGRTLDFLQSKSNGKFTSVYLSLVSGDFANSVKAMQFVQNTADTIEINVCADDTYDEIKMNPIIIGKLNYSMGSDMEFKINVVKEIPKDKSGKFRFIINNYSKQ